jgi:hypothetical protein
MAMRRLLLVAWVAMACDSSTREEHIAAAPETKKAPEPELPKKPEGPPTDPSLLDRMLLTEPTYLWSESQRLFACAGATRKGQDTTYGFALLDPTGKRLEEPVQLTSGAREFATKRKPIDATLAKGFAPLTRVPWPKHGRTLALPSGDIELEWTDNGEIAAGPKKKPVSKTALPRRDMVPIAAHVGPKDVALVEVTFDPKDATTLDVQYTDCVVVPLMAAP